MAETNLTLTLDDKVYEKAKTLFNEAGLTITSAFQKFVTKCVNDGEIPREAIEDTENLDEEELFYSKGNVEEILRRSKDLEEGKGILMTIEEFDAWTEELKAKYK